MRLPSARIALIAPQGPFGSSASLSPDSLSFRSRRTHFTDQAYRCAGPVTELTNCPTSSHIQAKRTTARNSKCRLGPHGQTKSSPTSSVNMRSLPVGRSPPGVSLAGPQKALGSHGQHVSLRGPAMPSQGRSNTSRMRKIRPVTTIWNALERTSVKGAIIKFG